MRSRTVAVAIATVLAALGVPNPAGAIIVVRHPVYHPVATVAAVAVIVAVASKPPPSTPPPPPSAPPPPPVMSPLPIDATMWQLPSGCLKLTTTQGETLFQCGPSWLKPQTSDRGPYYQVVPPPTAP